MIYTKKKKIKSLHLLFLSKLVRWGKPLCKIGELFRAKLEVLQDTRADSEDAEDFVIIQLSLQSGETGMILSYCT